MLLQCTAIFSQNNFSESESNSQSPEKQSKIEKFTASRFYQITHAAVPLTIGGLIVKNRDDRYRSLRNEYVSNFSYHYDDYLQYMPALAMLSLKTAGVEGRSSWGRMLTSDAFSVLLCVSLINGLKYSTGVLRPDGSTRNSFPSGHTAIAFMTATMLHKEYGLTRSPWYSIGGYSLAFATGISRQLNNRHWMSDIMVGAACGIISTELGYFLADLIFKNKGLVRANKKYRMYDESHPPTFLGIYLGVSFLLDSENAPDGRNVDIVEGNSAALEGAWFFNRYIGVGARAGVTGLKLKVDDLLMDEALDIISIQAGPYFSYPISVHWAIGSNLLGGYANIPSYDNDYIKNGRTGGFIWGAAASITYLPTRNLGIRGYLSYNYLPSIRAIQMIGHQTITLGGSVNIMF
ncbi:MAG: phosphatase PAP2 family protein [Bacteroidales bacterium]